MEEYEFIKPDQKVLVNGREFLGPLNVVRKSTLGEISFVDLGADGQTSANVAALATPLKEEKSVMGDSIYIGANASANPPATGEAVGIQAAGTPASGQPVENAVQKRRAEAAAESARIAAMHRLCDGKYPDIEAKAIREGWDARVAVGDGDTRPKVPRRPSNECRQRYDF